ncbi:unnamed protein product [Staurois parvus]|uniref:Uncharacterized protein n=1 Tax=Staurois parvus TaxID=386267 RepID=A0ABN9CKR3_9NEOB|nr:unnamed protein product [Staurois parvus]
METRSKSCLITLKDLAPTPVCWERMGSLQANITGKQKCWMEVVGT